MLKNILIFTIEKKNMLGNIKFMTINDKSDIKVLSLNLHGVLINLQFDNTNPD